jgi:hypothetical protein
MSVSPLENLRIRAWKGCAFAAIAAALAEYGASIDITSASAIGPQRATMTVPYTNVREEVRLYPDYGPIGASILASGDGAKDDKRPAAAKKGKP